MQMNRLTESRGLPPSDDLESAAMQWYVQSTATPLTDTEQAELRRWLAQSPEHAQAYRSADRFCQALDALDGATFEAFPHAPPALAASSTPPADRRRRVAHPWLRHTALAATLAGLLFGVWWTVRTLSPAADYATALGETRTVTLADGSTIDLNTDTAVHVDLSPTGRRISLMKGEAFFTVAADPARPFEVTAGRGRIRALGTAFAVRADGTTTLVSVQEHSVRVSSDRSLQSQDLTVGQQIRLKEDGTIGAVEAYKEDHRLAWRRNRLVFENRPLSHVIAELNRYRRGYIVMLDSTLSPLTVTAIFDTRNPEKALHTIERVLPVRLVRVTDHLIFVLRAPSS